MNSPAMSSAYGHELRPAAQYAEADSNPFPEVIVASAPEPCTTWRAPLQPDNADAMNRVSADEPPPVTKWESVKDWAALNKYWLFAAGVVLLLGLVATIVAVALVSQQSATNHSGLSKTTTTSLATTAVATATVTRKPSTASSTRTTSTTLSTAICDPFYFIARVNWMGISGVAGGWQFHITQSADAEACCMYCFTRTDGCNSWAFMPAKGSTSTACNIIFGWRTGVHVDHICPRGHADVRVARGTDTTYAGGAGPCGQIVW